MSSTLHIPRIIISGLKGGSGKTLLSLGLCKALHMEGFDIKPYKKGPDYIDAHWLGKAAHNSCTNLDPHFLPQKRIQSLFLHSFTVHAQEAQKPLALIEGNRGLFDGHDVQGSYSTAELAKTLTAPVILSLDITKMTRTSAAILQGIYSFDKNVHIAGVVLNAYGNHRHEKIVRDCIEYYTDIPVLGALPRLQENPLPERHMGLFALDSQRAEEEAQNTLLALGTFIREHCDIRAIGTIAQNAAPLDYAEPFWPTQQVRTTAHNVSTQTIRIAYIYDHAFWFYYAENLEALRLAGAELVPLSLLSSQAWPTDIDGVYLGGGYPEEFLAELSASPHIHTLRQWSMQHMPIYAECGGFMVLACAIQRESQSYPMAQVFPVQAVFYPRPQGLGYVTAHVCIETPYHDKDATIKGHEFHYSRCEVLPKDAIPHSLCQQSPPKLTLVLDKGMGMGTEKSSSSKSPNKDGLYIRRTFASYTHLYAPACPWWAPNFVRLAQKYREEQIC